MLEGLFVSIPNLLTKQINGPTDKLLQDALQNILRNHLENLC